MEAGQACAKAPTRGTTMAEIDLNNASGAKMALEKEMETYKKKLPELTAFEGKFVLIHGDDVIDTFSSYDDAIKEGYSRFKLEPFLVKRISSIEQIQFISRFVEPQTVR
jgi:hypothetical protein